MKIGFFGTPRYASYILEKLLMVDNLEVVYVVTQPDKKVGRKQDIVFSPVKNVALDNNIKIFQFEKIREQSELLEIDVDLIVTAAYGQIISSETLYKPKYNSVNLHASILPKYRGGAPIHWAIMNGETQTGVTLMYMNEKMDEGDIIDIIYLQIGENDNLKTILERLMDLAWKVLERNLDKFAANTIKGIKQNQLEATYAPTIKKEDEYISLELNAIDFHNKVRGLFPWPTGYIIFNDNKYKIIETRVINELNCDVDYGILFILNSRLFFKANDSKYIEIIKLQPDNKKPMLSKDFINGNPNVFKRLKDE